jgi:hypothetical protein
MAAKTGRNRAPPPSTAAAAPLLATILLPYLPAPSVARLSLTSTAVRASAQDLREAEAGRRLALEAVAYLRSALLGRGPARARASEAHISHLIAGLLPWAAWGAALRGAPPEVLVRAMGTADLASFLLAVARACWQSSEARASWGAHAEAAEWGLRQGGWRELLAPPGPATPVAGDEAPFAARFAAALVGRSGGRSRRALLLDHLAGISTICRVQGADVDEAARFSRECGYACGHLLIPFIHGHPPCCPCGRPLDAAE